MKKRCLIIFFIGIFFLVGCTFFSQKNQFSDYLKRNQYQFKNNCFQKTNGKESGIFFQKYCLEECKYYAMDSLLDDFFTLDMKSQEIVYVYDYITYRYNVKSKRTVCLFQGEEIDLESSYCKTAKLIVEQHLDAFQQELDNANVKMKLICI